ncbi:MAG: class IV adenylate cyclase [Calditrichota bacterium]
MGRNVEIKARLRNRAKAEAIAESLSTQPSEVIVQNDVFFPCTGGKLKLRIFSEDHGELITYHRPTGTAPRTSNYTIVPTDHPLELHQALEIALGTIGKVKKTRTLYRIGQTRVHLDRVENLGEFIELEVVLRPEQTEAEGKVIADELMVQLGINAADLIAVSYVDLIAARGR